MASIGHMVENLGDVMSQVETILNHYPDVKRWRNTLKQTINRAYQELCAEHDWDFLHKEVPFYLFPDLLIENTDANTGGAAQLVETRTVTITSYLIPGNLGQVNADGFDQQFASLVEGATFDVADVDSGLDDTVANWYFGPFVIEQASQVVTKTFTIVLDPLARLWLNGPAGAGFGTYTGQFRIRWDHYRLPVDCSEVIDLYEPDKAVHLEPWSASERRAAGLKEQAGEPSIYFRTHGHHQRRWQQPLRTGTGDALQWNSAAIQWPEELAGRINENPPVAPVGAGATGSGNLVSGTTYRVFYSWYFAGRYSPPSPVSEFTLSGTENQINLTQIPTIEMLNGGVDPSDFGRRLTVWVALEEGAFYFFGDVDPADPPVTTLSITTHYPKGLHLAGAPTTNRTMWPANTRWEDSYPGGPYQYIGVWPRPSEAKRYELHYKKHPRMLMEEADAPEMDRPFRSILVHAVVVELAARAGAEALKNTHAQLYAKVLKSMKRRHLTGVRRRVQKGRIDRHRYRARYPTPDYGGP